MTTSCMDEFARRDSTSRVPHVWESQAPACGMCGAGEAGEAGEAVPGDSYVHMGSMRTCSGGAEHDGPEGGADEAEEAGTVDLQRRQDRPESEKPENNACVRL